MISLRTSPYCCTNVGRRAVSTVILLVMFLLIPLSAGTTAAASSHQGSQGQELALAWTRAQIQVYEEPTAGRSPIGQLPEETLVIVTGESGDWWEIVYPRARSGHGWTLKAGLELVEFEDQSQAAQPTRPAVQETPVPASTPTATPPEGIVLANVLNVRSGPGLEYPIIGKLERGTLVEVASAGGAADDGWLQILYEGAEDETTAWVSSDYVAVDGEAIPASASSPLGSGEAPGLAGKMVFQERSGGTIYLMNADGTGLRRLATGLDPSLSPDGQQVAFSRWDIPRGLWIKNIDGTDERQLIGENLIKSPTWSPDGRWLAFNQQRGGTEARTIVVPGFGEFTIPADPYWRLAAIDVDGTSRDNLADQSHSFNPSWDGQGILYAAKNGLHVTEPGGGSRQIFFSNQSIRSPVRSPDGRTIAATMEFHDHWEIVLLNEDGSGLRRLTQNRGAQNSVAPVWSPDGRHIAFLTDREGAWDLWVMSADGSNQRPLAPSALNAIDLRYDFNAERVVHWGP